MSYSWKSQNSFAGGVISEKMFGRVELEQYQDSVAAMENYKVLPHGGASRRSGTKYGWTAKVTDTVRLIPFEYSADVSYVIEAGANYFRFGKNGAQILDTNDAPVELATDYADDELMALKFVQSGDIMWITHKNHRPQRLMRFADDEWYLDPVVFIDGPYFPVNATNATMVSSGATGAVTLTSGPTLTVTGVAAGAAWHSYGNKCRVTTSAAHGLSTGEKVTIAGVAGTTEVNGSGLTVEVITTTTFDVLVVFVNAYVSGGTVDRDLFVSTDVGRLVRIWHDGDAKWAWGEITSFSSGKSVGVTVVENNFPVAPTTTWRLGKWSDTTGWPGCVMLYEQRLAYAASPYALQDLDFSQTDAYNWFQTAADETLLATDALSWGLYSQSIDSVAWMHPGRGGLAVGTGGGCWIITGSNGKDDPLTPSSINAKKHEYIGVDETVMPVGIDNAVIFVDKSGKRVHEFAYLWEDDTYRAPDLTILSDHLTRAARVVDMDVQKTGKVVWFVLADGRLLGLTYMRAESVVAWHVHTPADTLAGECQFESVCCVTESREEVPYLVVSRTIDGSAVKTIEFLEADFDGADITAAYYLDCGISATLSPAGTSVTGLDHLEGETVMALVDGKVVRNLTVTSGAVTLPYDGTSVSVGLNYFSDIETLPLEQVNDQRGSTIGRVKDLGKVALRVTDSYGAKIGRDFDTLEEVKFNEGLVFSATPTLFSGERTKDKLEGSPATDVRVCIRQDIPLPLTINSLVCHYEVTED